MVLDKLLNHLKMSKHTRLMESDGDDESVYSKSAPSTASSKANLFPTSSPRQHRSTKTSFWSSPLKRALSKLAECKKLASWCRRPSKQDSSTTYASASHATHELTADRSSGADDRFCLDGEFMKARCERQELLIQQQREQLQQQQLLICQQRQQQSILCEKQQKLLEFQQQQQTQWFAKRQRHRAVQTKPRQERSQEQRLCPPQLRQTQTLQRAQQANKRKSKQSRSPLNSATCASPRKLRERLELLQRERRRNERLERSRHMDRTIEFDGRKGSQDSTSFIQADLNRKGCRAEQQNFMSPAQIYAKPGSEITVEMANGRYLKVRIDVQKQHRGRRCSTPTQTGFDSDRESELHGNYKPRERSPYHRNERRKHFDLPLISQRLTPNVNHERNRCARERRRALQSTTCVTCDQTHCRLGNAGVFFSIRKRCSSVPRGSKSNCIIAAPSHHVNSFSPDEQFMCHYL